MMGNFDERFTERLASLQGNANDPTRKFLAVASDYLVGQGTLANARRAG